MNATPPRLFDAHLVLDWGAVFFNRALTREVAGEREEEMLRQRALADDWPLPDAPQHVLDDQGEDDDPAT